MTSGIRRTPGEESGSNLLVKYRPFSRRRHRTLFRRWLRQRWRLMAVATGLTALMIAIPTLVLLTVAPDEPWRWYVMGGCHVLAIAAVVGLVNTAFHLHEAEAIHQLRGAWGEDNTREELRRAKRRRLIWSAVDSITLRTGDIDHLVVTRGGGLLVMDSKWRSATDRLDVDALAADASRVRTRAQGVIGQLLPAAAGQHRARGAAHQVTPVVVVWGPAQHVIPNDANVNGTAIVAGRRLLEWLRQVDGEVVDRDAGRDLARRLEGFRAERWASAMEAEAAR